MLVTKVINFGATDFRANYGGILSAALYHKDFVIFIAHFSAGYGSEGEDILVTKSTYVSHTGTFSL